MATPRSECLICEQESADGSMSIFSDEDDGGWAAGIVPGYDVPGWFVLRVRRQAEGLEGLPAEELATFGRRARDLTAAVRVVTGAAATYLMVFGEASPHFHALITPRTADVPLEMRTGNILQRRLGHADPHGSRAMVPEIRAAYERFASQSPAAMA